MQPFLADADDDVRAAAAAAAGRLAPIGDEVQCSHLTRCYSSSDQPNFTVLHPTGVDCPTDKAVAGRRRGGQVLVIMMKTMPLLLPFAWPSLSVVLCAGELTSAPILNPTSAALPLQP